MRHWDSENVRHHTARSENSSPLGVQRVADDGAMTYQNFSPTGQPPMDTGAGNVGTVPVEGPDDPGFADQVNEPTAALRTASDVQDYEDWCFDKGLSPYSPSSQNAYVLDVSYLDDPEATKKTLSDHYGSKKTAAGDYEDWDYALKPGFSSLGKTMVDWLSRYPGIHPDDTFTAQEVRDLGKEFADQTGIPGDAQAFYDKFNAVWALARKKTAASQDWIEYRTGMYELYHPSGFKAYVEDDLDEYHWSVENDQGDIIDDGVVNSDGPTDELDTAQQMAEAALLAVAPGPGVQYSASKTAAVWEATSSTGQTYTKGSASSSTEWPYAVIVREGDYERVSSWCKSLDNAERYLRSNEQAAQQYGMDADYELVTCRTASRIASKKTASMWDAIEPNHKVAGWDWNEQLAGYISEGASNHFACVCGSNIDAPGYVTCHCGRIWNASIYQQGGGMKLVCREVPNRGAEVILASRD